MPLMDGVECTMKILEILEKEKILKTKIIALTAF